MSNAFHYRDLVIIGKIARLLGENDDAEMLNKQHRALPLASRRRRRR
ncbi:MAG: hypothetical protein ACODAD_13195 [Planctomycetota bacterium]